jgi:RHS repeat-associated protein
VVDAATGLVYMQDRYYDPLSGQFITPDAVTVLGGDLRHFNRYSYAYNNPYKYTDPDGRCPSCAGGAIGFGLDLAIQVAEMAMGTRTEISGTSLLVSAGSGALGVGLAGKFGQLGGLAVDAAISATSTAAKGEDVTLSGTVVDVILGQGASKGAANVIRQSDGHKVAARQANRTERIGNKPHARDAQRARAAAASPSLRQAVDQKAAQAGVVGSGVGSAVENTRQEMQKKGEVR